MRPADQIFFLEVGFFRQTDMFTGFFTCLVIKVTFCQGLVQLLFFFLQGVSLFGDISRLVFDFFAQAINRFL